MQLKYMLILMLYEKWIWIFMSLKKLNKCNHQTLVVGFII